MNTHPTLRSSDDTGRFTDKVRDLGFGMKDVAGRGMNTMSEHAHAAQRELGRYASTAGRYVTEQPLKSALVAAGIGALVAGVIIALRHKRNH